MSLNLIWKVEKYLRNIYDLGQGQAPTNWIREPRHDLIAFPELYSYGIGGVNFERLVKLCKTDFFSVKFLNRNKMYAKNSDYLFVCQQFLERHLLESNISVKAQKGKVQKGPDGTKIISCDNAFDIFSKIPGTPHTGRPTEMSYLLGSVIQSRTNSKASFKIQ